MSTREERQRAIDAAVLQTITGADWAAMFRRRDWLRNGVREQIGAARSLFLSERVGKTESETIKESP